MVPLTGGERPPFEVLAERLRGQRLGLPDGRPRPDPPGVQVDFFGEPTRMPAGPAKLAHGDRRGAAAGALLVRHRDGWVIDIYPALDTRRVTSASITQALADRFAANIAAHPADWHMLQPQWLADLSEERRGSAARTGG